MERFYELSDSRIAFIFPAQLVGYILSTLTTQSLHFYYGRRGLAWCSSLLRIFPIIVLSTGPPFPVALVCYFVFGCGTGFTDSGWCAWATELPYVNVYQGFLHGSYGLGAILGPLITIVVLKRGFEWYKFYRGVAAALILEIIAQGWTFRHDTAAVYRRAFAALETSKLFNPLSTKFTWICGALYLVDVGIESSFNDWIVIYMQRTHHADTAASRLASSVFWIGMSLGRFTLGPVTEYCGLSKSVSVYIICSTFLQVLFRAASSVKAALVMLGGVGFFCGPLFPSGLLLLTKALPQHAHVGAVAAAAGMGQIGGALIPLGLGFMAEHLGIRFLLDVVIGLSMLMLLIWILFSWLTKKKRLASHVD